jgi:hypothetical protein
MFVTISYNNSQFGLLRISKGDFNFLGQDKDPEAHSRAVENPRILLSGRLTGHPDRTRK